MEVKRSELREELGWESDDESLIEITVAPKPHFRGTSTELSSNMPAFFASGIPACFSSYTSMRLVNVTEKMTMRVVMMMKLQCMNLVSIIRSNVNLSERWMKLEGQKQRRKKGYTYTDSESSNSAGGGGHARRCVDDVDRRDNSIDAAIAYCKASFAYPSPT